MATFQRHECGHSGYAYSVGKYSGGFNVSLRAVVHENFR